MPSRKSGKRVVSIPSSLQDRAGRPEVA